MKTEGPNIPFDKFANEDLWTLSSLRAFLFDEYRTTQDINELPKVTVSLPLQFDRHMVAAPLPNLPRHKHSGDLKASIMGKLAPQRIGKHYQLTQEEADK